MRTISNRFQFACAVIVVAVGACSDDAGQGIADPGFSRMDAAASDRGAVDSGRGTADLATSSLEVSGFDATDLLGDAPAALDLQAATADLGRDSTAQVAEDGLPEGGSVIANRADPSTGGDGGAAAAGHDADGTETGTLKAPTGDGKAYFQLSPSDLTTAADGATIAVQAEQPGPVPMELLNQLADKVSLIAWPEGTTVAWTASYQIAASFNGVDPFSKLVVLPNQPLSARWYALKVAPLEGHLAIRPMTASVEALQPGETMARFRYGSEPRVVAIDESHNEEDPRYPIFSDFPYFVQVLLSEAVPTTDAVAAFSLTGPGTTGCAPAPAQGEITTSVAFECQASVLKNLGLVVGPLPIRGSAGVRTSSTTIQVDPSRLVEVTTDVNRYNVDLR